MVQSSFNFIFNAFEVIQSKFKELADSIANNPQALNYEKFNWVKQKNQHEIDFVEYYLNQPQQLLVMPQMKINFIAIEYFHLTTILLYLYSVLKFLRNYNFTQFFLFFIQIYSTFQIYFQCLVIIFNYLKLLRIIKG